MLQARPHRIEPRMNVPTPMSMIGLRPNWSLNLAKIGTDTDWASRNTENSHGNWAKPPRSSTIEGTAVAKMVESMATSPTLSITEARMGPRSDRSPTSARVICSVRAIRRPTGVRAGLFRPAKSRRCPQSGYPFVHLMSPGNRLGALTQKEPSWRSTQHSSTATTSTGQPPSWPARWRSTGSSARPTPTASAAGRCSTRPAPRPSSVCRALAGAMSSPPTARTPRPRKPSPASTCWRPRPRRRGRDGRPDPGHLVRRRGRAPRPIIRNVPGS